MKMVVQKNNSAKNVTLAMHKGTRNRSIKVPQPVKNDDVDDKQFCEIEKYLHQKIEKGDKPSQFLLGQFYFEEGYIEKALAQFESIKDWNYQAMYQLATMYYDGIGVEKNEEKGFHLMMTVAASKSTSAQHLLHSAQFNIGRAYFEGYGVNQSNIEAERWWVMAADDGNPRASVQAQTTLGMLYSRPEFLNLKQAHFWHSEACGNGSIESQGALGVMYLEGLGIAKDSASAYECLKGAAIRGNVYAQGRLIELFYKWKIYTKAADLAKRVVSYDDIEKISKDTGCFVPYIRKGIAYACFYLSRCLHLGKGIRKNQEQAKILFSRACELEPVLAHEFFMDVAYGYL